MKHWYYVASDEPDKKYYFNTYDDTQFAIICRFRFKAPINEIPDYSVYKDGELIEIATSEMLMDIYLENGGRVYEDCLNKKKDNNKIPNKQAEIDELADTIESTNKSLQQLTEDIKRLTEILTGGIK